MKADASTSVGEHFKFIQREGEAYLSQALRRNPSAVTRQRILQASLRYLESRADVAAGHASQSSQLPSQGIFLSQSVAGLGPKSSFQTVLSSAINQDIDTAVLMEACTTAVNCQLLPILVKCLYVLSTLGSVQSDALGDNDDPMQSPEEYSDHDLFGDPESDKENANQTGKVARARKAPPSASGPGKKRNESGKGGVGRTGQSFVDEFVARLAGNLRGEGRRNTASNALFVSSLAREAPLSELAGMNILRLLTKELKNVDLMELPPFMYQLLLLASARGNSDAKTQVLVQLSQVFTRFEKEAQRMQELSQSIMEEDEDAITVRSTSTSDLRQVQGTALLHVEYAVKQDPSLLAEILKLTKSSIESTKHFLTSFGIAIVLSLARANATHSDVLHALRDAVIKFVQQEHLRRTNLYCARVTMNDDRSFDLCKTLLSVAESTVENGWEHVKESTVNFAFLLLDKPVSEKSGAEHNGCTLGEGLLLSLFKAHVDIRSSILEQLSTRIALQERSSEKVIGVLRKLGKTVPFYILEHSQIIKTGIEFLTTLPPWTAAGLIEAYAPLIGSREDLRDYFQLVMRKSLFHRDSSSRAVAILGFLKVLELNCGSSGDRAQSKKQTDVALEIVLDAIQPLRRVLSYSAPLRAFFYKSAINNVHKLGKRQSNIFASALGELLQGHLRAFVDLQNAPHLILDKCVNESAGGTLIEPLGDLMWCIAMMEYHQTSVPYQNSCIVDLARKIASVSIQDFVILKQLQSPGENEGGALNAENAEEVAAARANRNKVRVLGSVLESLIHAFLLVSPESRDASADKNTLIPLLLMKGKVIDALRRAKISTSANAFADFGGDLAIEKLSPGMKMYLQGGGKSASGKGKKRTAVRARKDGDNENTNDSGNMNITDHRFGLFSVLASTMSSPSLSLKTAVTLLLSMKDTLNGRESDGASSMQRQLSSRDCEMLRSYLFAVANKHVEEFVSSMSKGALQENDDMESLTGAIESLTKLSMTDFKRCRRSTASNSRQDATTALQIANKCAQALVYFAGNKKSVIASFCKALVASPSILADMTENEVFESCAEGLEHLVESLVDDDMLKEASYALQMHRWVVQSVIGSMKNVEEKCGFWDKRVAWGVEMVGKKAILDVSVVKALVQICMVYTENNNDLRRAGHLSHRLHVVLRDCDENVEVVDNEHSENEELCSAHAVGEKTSFAVVDGVLDVIEQALTDVEWCLERMISLEGSLGNSAVIHYDQDGVTQVAGGAWDDMIAKQAIRAEDAAQLRLEGIVRTTSSLARCAIGKWGQQERLLKLITKTYKMLCMAVQAQTKRQGDPRGSFTSLIEECKVLSPVLWTYVAFVGEKQEGGAKREARVMPQLVYEVERFEKVLIAVQKKTKVNLLRGIRRNVARDFRIREDVLGQQGEEEEGEEGDEDSRRKRRRSE